MFTERYRSHHDSEYKLTEILSQKNSGKEGASIFRIATTRAAQLAASGARWNELEQVLKQKSTVTKAGVYFHVPFCDKICTFCNLNRKERKGADLDSYTDYLVSEIKNWGQYPYIQQKQIEVVYFGGGTPTVLNAEHFKKILGALKDYLPLTKDCEISVESTQHNLNTKKVAILEEAGVNRFSVGIQTFSDRGRVLLGRSYSGEKVNEALKTLRKDFSGVLGIDIIYSYPEQTISEIEQDAAMCINSGVDSVSFYSLMIQKGSALSKTIDRNELVFTRNIEFDLERHNLFFNSLKNAGFNLLELTKLSRNDRYRYIHIQYGGYDLIPIGAGAGGKVAGFPMYSMSQHMRVVSSPSRQYEKYYRVLGLLQFGVFDPEIICRDLSCTTKEAVMVEIESLAAEGLLVPDTDSVSGKKIYSLSADGVFWGNNVAVQVLETAITAERSESNEQKEAENEKYVV